MKARCEVSRQDDGCEQFEVFQSAADPDKLVLLELWKDQAALDAHAILQAQRPLEPVLGPRIARTRGRRGCGSAPASARTIPTTAPAEPGEAPKCRPRISKPGATTRPRTCRGNGRCRPAPMTARRVRAPFAAWSSAAGMPRNWGSTGSASPSTIILRAS